jgi:formate dehydrogenase subunit gamma
MMDAEVSRTSPRLYVHRYTALQRVNHWITAILFLLLALSGLAMAYPWLYFLSVLFGGGAAARNIHPWLGVALSVSFFILAIQFVRNNMWNRDDIKWIRHVRSVMANEHEGLPELGKYNAGQKGIYWSQVLLIPILLVTGLIVWQQYFGHWTTIETQRVTLLIHSLAGVIAITVIINHIYAGIWIRGTLRGMTRGTVTGGWAYHHHRRWLRETLARGGDGRSAQIGSASTGDD